VIETSAKRRPSIEAHVRRIQREQMNRFPDILETERLVIRPIDPNVAEAVNAAILASYRELNEWLPWADHIPDIAETRAHLTVAQEQYHAGTDCGLGIWLKQNGAFVGSSGLHPRPADPAWREVGYWLHSGYRGQGLATEAVRAIATTGLRDMGFEGIELRASERNTASHRVAERAGFTRVASLENGRIDPGGYPARTLLFVLRR
jgi:ribosomal-protein-serine acetyltransferase